MTAIESKNEFHALNEAAVLASLEDPRSQNAVAVEVGRLVAAYTTALRGRPVSPDAAPVETKCPIEGVALRLATKLAGVPVVKGSP